MGAGQPSLVFPWAVLAGQCRWKAGTERVCTHTAAKSQQLHNSYFALLVWLFVTLPPPPTRHFTFEQWPWRPCSAPAAWPRLLAQNASPRRPG